MAQRFDRRTQSQPAASPDGADGVCGCTERRPQDLEGLVDPTACRSWTVSPARRRLLWVSSTLLLVLVSGLVPPSAVGLEPTVKELRRRLVDPIRRQSGDDSRTVGDLIEQLGVGRPRHATRYRLLPNGDREVHFLNLRSNREKDAGWSPSALPAFDAEQAQWIRLEWNESSPWLIALLEYAAPRTRLPAQWLLWELGERLPPKGELIVIGSPTRGWEAVAVPESAHDPSEERRVEREARFAVGLASP